MTTTNSYSTFVPPPEDSVIPVPNGAAISHNPGCLTTTISGDDSNTRRQQVNHLSGNDFSVFEPSDWRSTARNPNGGTRTNTPTEDSIVEIDGVSASIATFMQIGAIVKDGDSFALADKQQAAPVSQDSGDMITVTPEQQRASDEALAPFSDATFNSCIANAPALVLDQMSYEDMVAKVSLQSGLDPADTASRMDVVRSMFQSHADAAVVKAGLHADDLPEFYAWCKGSANKAKLTQAIQGQLYEGKLGGYRPLVAGYMAATAPSADVLKANGFDTRKLSGTEEVRVNGKWWPITSAARAGLI